MGKKGADAREGELDTHRDDDEAHEERDRIVNKPAGGQANAD